MGLLEWQGWLQGVTFGSGTNYRFSSAAPVSGVGVPSPKAQDVNLEHGDGAYAGVDRKGVRVITIPLTVLGVSPIDAMDNFETLAAAFEASATDVQLELYLPGKHFAVTGRPRGITDDLGRLKESVIECMGLFVANDPTMGLASVKTVSNKALTSNVATLTTSTAHGFTAGRLVVVESVDSTFNGSYTIASTPTSTTFTYAKTAANVGSTAATGTATSFV